MYLSTRCCARGTLELPAASEEILVAVAIGGGLVDRLHGLEGQGNPRRGHLAALVVVLAVPDEFGHGNEISQGESLQSGGRSKGVQPTRYRVAGVMKVSLRWSREGEGRPRTSLRL